MLLTGYRVRDVMAAPLLRLRRRQVGWTAADREHPRASADDHGSCGPVVGRFQLLLQSYALLLLQ